MSYQSAQSNNNLIRETFVLYLVSTPPKSISASHHPLFPKNCFTCQLSSLPCIGYYQILNTSNYFPKLQQLQLLKSMNSRGVFVEFMGVWLEQQQDSSIVIYTIFQKLVKSIKQLLFAPEFNDGLFWEYLVSITKAMLFLGSKKLSHRNLNLYSLLVKSNNPKLFYFPSMNNSLNIWHSSKQDRDFLFLSPQEILAYKTNSQKYDALKSDVFNLGTILFTVLNSNTIDSYQDQCEKRLNNIQKQYGFNIYFILQKMTRIQVKDRIQWYEIQPYVNELYEKRRVLGNSLEVQEKQSILDFRQGSFQKILQNEKELIKYQKQKRQNKGYNKSENKRRTHIFSGKRNLLDYDPTQDIKDNRKTQVASNEQCMVAQCYLKL